MFSRVDTRWLERIEHKLDKLLDKDFTVMAQLDDLQAAANSIDAVLTLISGDEASVIAKLQALEATTPDLAPIIAQLQQAHDHAVIVDGALAAAGAPAANLPPIAPAAPAA